MNILGKIFTNPEGKSDEVSLDTDSKEYTEPIYS